MRISRNSVKPFLRFIICILGLSAFGVLITEILKKWHIVSMGRSPWWVVLPILLLFVAKEAIASPTIINQLKLSPTVLKGATLIINSVLVLLGILAFISIPFLWFGAIEETASQGYR